MPGLNVGRYGSTSELPRRSLANEPSDLLSHYPSDLKNKSRNNQARFEPPVQTECWDTHFSPPRPLPGTPVLLHLRTHLQMMHFCTGGSCCLPRLRKWRLPGEVAAAAPHPAHISLPGLGPPGRGSSRRSACSPDLPPSLQRERPAPFK